MKNLGLILSPIAALFFLSTAYGTESVADHSMVNVCNAAVLESLPKLRAGVKLLTAIQVTSEGEVKTNSAPDIDVQKMEKDGWLRILPSSDFINYKGQRVQMLILVDNRKRIVKLTWTDLKDPNQRTPNTRSFNFEYDKNGACVVSHMENHYEDGKVAVTGDIHQCKEVAESIANDRPLANFKDILTQYDLNPALATGDDKQLRLETRFFIAACGRKILLPGLRMVGRDSVTAPTDTTESSERGFNTKGSAFKD